MKFRVSEKRDKDRSTFRDTKMLENSSRPIDRNRKNPYRFRMTSSMRTRKFLRILELTRRRQHNIAR